MAKLIIISWRDIPSQVIVKKGRTSAKVQLSERFQVAIDKAAMRAGKQGSAEYLDDWKRTYSECGNNLEHEANLAADQYETEYSNERLALLAKSKGIDSEKEPESEIPESHMDKGRN